jgi:hypothetical protein
MKLIVIDPFLIEKAQFGRHYHAKANTCSFDEGRYKQGTFFPCQSPSL